MKWRISTWAQLTHGVRLMFSLDREQAVPPEGADGHREEDGQAPGEGGGVWMRAEGLPRPLTTWKPKRECKALRGRLEAVERALDERPGAGTRRSREAGPREGAPRGPAGSVIALQPCPRARYLLCPTAQLLQPSGWMPAAPSLLSPCPEAKE